MPFNSFSRYKKAGFDYVGLGHKISIIKNMYNGRVCYAGSLEPLSCKETGPHGYISGFIHSDETRISFVPASEKEYKTIQYPVSNYMTDEELCEELIRLMKQEGEPAHFSNPSGKTEQMREDISYKKTGFQNFEFQASQGNDLIEPIMMNIEEQTAELILESCLRVWMPNRR